MVETISLDDLKLFAAIAEAPSLSAAAATLSMPRQTLSRRLAALERALGRTLLFRTTRRMQLTEAGRAFGQRCLDVARLAEEVVRSTIDEDEEPRGTLRVTADPVFGEAFLTPLVLQFSQRWPSVRTEVVLTRRRVDVLDEGFDAAFRIGRVDDPQLIGVKLGPARVRLCASPRYLRAHGRPGAFAELTAHELVVVADSRAASVWPQVRGGQLSLLPVSPRLLFSSFEMARAAVLAGHGIGLFSEFVCEPLIAAGRLEAVLGEPIDVGAIWLLHPSSRAGSARVRAFVAMSRAWFSTWRSGPVRPPAQGRGRPAGRRPRPR